MDSNKQSEASRNEYFTDENLNMFYSLLRTEISDNLQDVIKGFYIHGSIFTDGFVEKTSDIDYTAIVNEPIDENMFKRVKAFHLRLNELTPYAHLLDGAYYFLDYNDPWKIGKTIWVGQDGLMQIEEDSFDPDIDEFIRGKGYTVYGQLPQFALPYASTVTIRRYSKKYIETLLSSLKEGSNPPSSIWHKLLNACRSAYYITNGNFPEKKVLAATWVKKKYPEFSYLIEKAMDIRRGKKFECILSTNESADIERFLQTLLTNQYVVLPHSEGLNKPMRMEIQMTTGCNCRCPHCGYFTINKPEENTIQSIEGFILEAQKSWGWVDRVLFEGGEPTTDFDKLIRCIRYSSQSGIPNVQVNTNLVNVSIEQIKRMAYAGCNYLEVSVDAINPSKWLVMRGMADTEDNLNVYRAFCDALKFACKQPGIIVDFNYTPTTLNISELGDVFRTACNFGARFFSFQNLVCSTPAIKKIAVSPDDLSEGIETCRKISGEYNFPPTVLLCCSEAVSQNIHRNYGERVETFECSCGTQYVYMNHKNEIRLCCFGSGLSIGKYTSGNFSSIWESKGITSFTGCPVCREMSG